MVMPAMGPGSVPSTASALNSTFASTKLTLGKLASAAACGGQRQLAGEAVQARQHGEPQGAGLHSAHSASTTYLLSLFDHSWSDIQAKNVVLRECCSCCQVELAFATADINQERLAWLGIQ